MDRYTNRLNAAIVGCGEIAAERHVPSWLADKKAKIVAVCDVDKSKARFMAERLHVTDYTDYMKMLDNESIDVVDIAVPIKLHGKLAIAAMQKGKNVIVEKPLAGSTEEAREMINLAKHMGVKLSVFHTMKAYPVIWKAKNLLEEGEIGRAFLLHFLTSCGKLQPWVMQQGGKLWEVGMHRIYLTQYLFGEVKKVKVEPHGDGAPDENLTLTLFTEIHLLDSESGSETITIHGEKGKILIPGLAFNTLIKTSQSQKTWSQIFSTEIISNLKSSSAIFRRGMKYLVKKDKILPHFIIIDNFIDSILSQEKLLIPPEEGLEAIRVLEEIDKNLKREHSRTENT
jgi:predicted dehydrogenase